VKDIIKAKANINIWIIDYKAKNKRETINHLSKKDINLKLYLDKKKIHFFINKKNYTFSERFLKYLKKPYFSLREKT
jgi:sucrose-6-phosphate hydrolase SacC (GH32 family)